MSVEVIAVAVSDLHLDHKPPSARLEKGSGWYKVMSRQLEELKTLCIKYDCPLIVAGDVFNDGWRTTRTPPELVNFAIEHFSHFKQVFAVPGQHDLPYHRYEDLEKSAYYTLVKAGVITDLKPNNPVKYVTKEKYRFNLYGYPWGSKYLPEKLDGDVLKVAVVHRYCWADGHSHPGASEKDHVCEVPRQFPGFNVVIFGDNHRGFSKSTRIVDQKTVTLVVNCGTFFRRTSAEKDYQPRAYLICKDGTVSYYDYYTTVQDKWVSYQGLVESRSAVDKFAASLDDIKVAWESFPTTVVDEMKRRGVDSKVRKAVLKCLEDSTN